MAVTYVGVEQKPDFFFRFGEMIKTKVENTEICLSSTFDPELFKVALFAEQVINLYFLENVERISFQCNHKECSEKG